jgi:acetyl esterase/lipase
MTMPEAALRPTRHVPARDLPVPASISPQAQAMMALQRPPAPPYPALNDKPAWRAYVEAMNAYMLPLMRERGAHVAAQVEEISAGDAPVYAVTPDAVAADARGVFLDIHGGAFIVGGGESCRAEAIVLAGAVQARVWSIDYRAPPDHPYPAPLDDCMAAYRALLEVRRPEEIVVGGASAGANLAAALVLRARDEGLPPPGGCVLLTPGLDMTNAGDSRETNRGVDAVLTGDMNVINHLYAGGHDLADPYLSPVLGDVARGFCPTFLSAGTRDLFLSDAVRMHMKLRAADVPADLYLIEAASHGGFHGAPEEAELDRQVRNFVHGRFAAARAAQ